MQSDLQTPKFGLILKFYSNTNFPDLPVLWCLITIKCSSPTRRKLVSSVIGSGLVFFFILISHSSWASAIRNVMMNSNVVYPSPHLLSKDKTIRVVEWFFIDLFMFDMWTVLQGLIAELYSICHQKIRWWNYL